MKKNLSYFLATLLMIVAVNSGCKKTDETKTPLPVADFTFSGAGGDAPCTVTFTNKSTDGQSYNWDFGDGETSTDKNPQHIFTSGGTFTVQLTATNTEGTNKTSKTVNISTPAAPSANFTISGDGNFAPCEVTFTNTSSNATSYSWNFGDGSSTVTQENPKHTFASGGVFSVTLTASGSGGSNSITKVVNIKNAPTKLKMTKLTLTDYPQTNSSGGGWDNNSGPDIYYKIMDENQTTTYFTGGTHSDVAYNDLPLIYTTGLPVTFIDLDEKYTIVFYDYDNVGSDDFIGGYYFTPSDRNGYPSVISFSSSTSDLKFEIEVTWLNSKGIVKTGQGKEFLDLVPIER